MAYKFALIVLLLPLHIFAQGNRCGSSWIQYSDEKCFLFIDNFINAEEALSLCRFENPSASLPIIKSVGEQKFINDYLYLEHGVLDGVWLGANRVNSTTEFTWINGDDLSSFSNWAPGTPSNETNRNCARMVSSDGKSTKDDNGQWEDVSCETRNLVLCQKPPQFSHEELVEELLKLRFNFHEFKQTILPVGFLYFQVGTQPSPKDLWPGYNWEEVSGDYAGLFFRVAGDGADPIGTIQPENAPRLGEIQYSYNTLTNYPNSISVPSSGWSEYVEAGSYMFGFDGWEGLRFQMANAGEVRPKNTAMRVWKRI